MDQEQKVTTDRQIIEAWAAKYHGTPEIVGYENGAGEPTLRIDFPGKEDEAFLSAETKLRQVSWDDFFREFDRQRLAFEYREYDHLVDPSTSYHFIKREAIDE